MTWLRPIDRWFAEEVLPHERHYLRCARQWVRGEEAADLVQEAYLKLLQFDDWRSIRDPRAYAVTTIRNLVLQRVRRSQVVSITDIPTQNLVEVPDERPDVFDVVASREALASLLSDVERLPRICRQVIRMRKFEDLPPREIARLLNISTSTVETHLARGMRQLMDRRRAPVSQAPARETDDDGDMLAAQ